MEKVDEKLGVLAEGQQEILTTLQKLQNKSNNIAERIKEQEKRDNQDLIQFVKSAKRIYIYNGDKSSLDRLNKKRRNNYIERIIILLILIALSLSVIALPYGWIPIIPTTIVCIPNLYYSFLHLKPSHYEYDYDSFNSNKWMRCDYDDNGIICGNDDKLIWNLCPIFVKYLAFIVCVLLVFVSIFNGVLIYLIAVPLSYILGMINLFVFRRIYIGYTLHFTDGDRKMPYSQIKNFMTENGLK